MNITFDLNNPEERAAIIRMLTDAGIPVAVTTVSAAPRPPGRPAGSPNKPKPAPTPAPVPEETPEDDTPNTEAANDPPADDPVDPSLEEPTAPVRDEAKDLAMRDLAKKLIAKDRTKVQAIFTKYKVKLLSEVPPEKVDAVTAEFKKALA